MSNQIKKKLAKLETPEEISAELGHVFMSSESIAKMSLNPYDQLFICRLMSMRDEAIKDEISTALAEVLAAQNKRMFDTLDEQTTLIKGIATDVLIIKQDLASVKRKQEEDERVMLEFDKRLCAKKERLGKIEKEVTGLKRRLGVIEKQVKSLSNGSSDAS